jgi:hypothetical protein
MARRWCAVLVGFATALSCLAALGVASAAPEPTSSDARAAKATRLTLTVSADEVDYGTRVRLSGRLTAGGKGIKRQKVVLKARVGASRTWTKIGTVTTSRRGTWKKVVEARLHTTHVAVYKGNQTYAPSKAPRSEVAVAAPLSDVLVTPGNRDAYKDEAWTWTGRTAPELAGQRVSLVRGPFRASTTVRTATIGPGGAILLTHQMSDVGSYEYWLNVNSSALMYGRDSARTLIRTRREGAPTPPSIATTSLPSVEVHVPYQASLVGGGGELTWSVVGGTFPPGLSLDPGGLITGRPIAVGSWSFTVQAANPVGTATRTLELTSLPGTLTVTTYPLYDAAVGRSYPDAPYSSGGWQEMFCTPCPQGADWSVTAGTPPPGMDLFYDDLLEPPANYVGGRPTVAGVHQFTVTGVAGQHSGSKVFTLRVLPSPSSLLWIAHDVTLSIPNGTLGQPYSHQFQVPGESGLAWSALTPLPPGLTLSPSGLLHGVPTMTGTGWIDVAATDGTRYDWQGFGFTVQAPP